MITFIPQLVVFSLLYVNEISLWIIDNDGAVILSIIGISCTAIVAYLFKFKWKPQIEIVFEEKINDALYVIFNNLNLVDRNFDYHFGKINEYMKYEVVKGQNSLVRGDPNVILFPELTKLNDTQSKEIKDYENWLKLEKHIKTHALPKLKARHDEFITDKNFTYLNTYIARTTFFAITNYIRVSHWFFDHIEYNEINWFYLDERKQFANQIINYCEKHKIPKKGYDEGFLKFKQRWDKK